MLMHLKTFRNIHEHLEKNRNMSKPTHITEGGLTLVAIQLHRDTPFFRHPVAPSCGPGAAKKARLADSV